MVHATLVILARFQSSCGIDGAAGCVPKLAEPLDVRDSTERVAGLAADGSREARLTAEAGAVRKECDRTLSDGAQWQSRRLEPGW
jgi:hypothetical protein